MQATKTILFIGCEPAFVFELVTLFNDSFKLRAFVPTADVEFGSQIKQKGVEVCVGSLQNSEHLKKAMEGVYAVIHAAPRGHTDNEETMGRKIGEAAMYQQVQRYIYISTAACDCPVGLSAIEVKCKLDKFFHTLSLPVTVIRLVSVMEDLLDVILAHKYASWSNIVGHDKIQIISWKDAARFVKFVLENENQFVNKTISIAGEELDKKEIKGIYEKVTGEKLDKLAVPMRGCSYSSSPVAPMDSDPVMETFKMFNLTGYHADIQECIKSCPNMLTWEDLVKKSISCCK